MRNATLEAIVGRVEDADRYKVPVQDRRGWGKFLQAVFNLDLINGQRPRNDQQNARKRRRARRWMRVMQRHDRY